MVPASQELNQLLKQKLNLDVDVKKNRLALKERRKSPPSIVGSPSVK